MLYIYIYIYLCVCVCVVVISAVLLTINVVLNVCWCPWVTLDSGNINHYNCWVLVIPVLGSEMSSGGMV